MRRFAVGLLVSSFEARVISAVAAGLGLASGLAQAQPAARPWAAVRGYVYDSLLTFATVPGAHVVLSGPTNKEVIADSRGRFVADSLQPGQYTITFTHLSWEQVGYTPAERTVELRAGTMTPLFLSSTAGQGIFARICPNVREERTGAVLGQLTDVNGNRPIAGAEVRVEWSESLISREQGVSRHIRALRSPTDSLGRYTICGVPNDAAVLFRARANGVDGPPLELDLRERPLAIRMLALDLARNDSAGRAGNEARSRGTAVLEGIVRGTDGRPVAGAQILVLGLDDGARSAESGGFRLDSLLGGTHTVEVRAIGFARRREMVTLRPDRPTNLEVQLTRMAVVLPEIEVKVAAAQSEFDRRRTSMAGAGHFITRDDIGRRNPLRTEDLFRGVPGLSVVPSGGFDYTVVSTRGPGGLSGQCSPDFYVDGSKVTVDPQVSGGLPVSPGEIYGIESYSGTASTPAQYQGSGCGVVLIWTQRGGRKR